MQDLKEILGDEEVEGDINNLYLKINMFVTLKNQYFYTYRKKDLNSKDRVKQLSNYIIPRLKKLTIIGCSYYGQRDYIELETFASQINEYTEIETLEVIGDPLLISDYPPANTMIQDLHSKVTRQVVFKNFNIANMYFELLLW